MNVRRALVTGGAGFIGSHLVDRLLAEGWHVTTLDNFDSFYSRHVKQRNIQRQLNHPHFRLVEADIRDYGALTASIAAPYDVIVHLAALTNVRRSVEAADLYRDVNVGGTRNILRLAGSLGVRQFVFASSSSVYGVNPNVPWQESDDALMPVSPYASTKIAGESLGREFSRLFGIRFIALRFFTVYGPRQRPDLAIHKFARMILAGQPLPVYGSSLERRDYTYVDDIVGGIMSAAAYGGSEFEIMNLGSGQAVPLCDMVRHLEKHLQQRAILSFQPTLPADVPQTWADVSKARALLGYKPRMDFSLGVACFVEWMFSQMGPDVIAATWSKGEPQPAHPRAIVSQSTDR